MPPRESTVVPLRLDTAMEDRINAIVERERAAGRVTSRAEVMRRLIEWGLERADAEAKKEGKKTR